METIGKPTAVFDECFDDVKHMVADEAFGCRDVDDLSERFVYDEDLNLEHVERIKKFAMKRNFYLDNDTDYRAMIRICEKILNSRD